jgi:hypothetical protein
MPLQLAACLAGAGWAAAGAAWTSFFQLAGGSISKRDALCNCLSAAAGGCLGGFLASVGFPVIGGCLGGALGGILQGICRQNLNADDPCTWISLLGNTVVGCFGGYLSAKELKDKVAEVIGLITGSSVSTIMDTCTGIHDLFSDS